MLYKRRYKRNESGKDRDKKITKLVYSTKSIRLEKYFYNRRSNKGI